ncbi:MAG: hypothetical protein JO164_03895 [Candidatus Eremiobacteraeota bacterium]|nr:hypothetical protein [Candidatus Eremiobacteraeota bacterium]
MLQRILAGAVLCVLAFGTAALADDQNPTNPTGPLNAAETAFVKSIQADLTKRFPNPATAERAGYVRYTNADDTGAISYANMHWDSADAQHPSQLWYSAKGELLGADFSMLTKPGSPRPHRWGIDPGRWTEFDAHVHYVLIDPATGKKIYDRATSTKKFAAAGGDPNHPTAQTLAKMGVVKSAKDVSTVFLFPTIWDLVVWVKPNPNGPFADKNPTVTAKS